MRFLIDLDGPLLNIRPRLCALHDQVARDLGLPPKPAELVWQMIRRGEPIDRHVPTARSPQREAYKTAFRQGLERDDLLELDQPQPGAVEALPALKSAGPCFLITLRTNKPGAQAALDRFDIWPYFQQMRVLSRDSDRRSRQVAELAGGDRKTMVITSSESILVAARECALFCVGIGAGPATPNRLRRFGADYLADSLSDLVDAMRPLSDELRRAGWIG